MSVSGRKEDQAALETRALMYWNAALPLLEKMERQQTVRVYNTTLFEYYRFGIFLRALGCKLKHLLSLKFQQLSTLLVDIFTVIYNIFVFMR